MDQSWKTLLKANETICIFNDKIYQNVDWAILTLSVVLQISYLIQE